MYHLVFDQILTTVSCWASCTLLCVVHVMNMSSDPTCTSINFPKNMANTEVRAAGIEPASFVWRTKIFAIKLSTHFCIHENNLSTLYTNIFFWIIYLNIYLSTLYTNIFWIIYLNIYLSTLYTNNFFLDNLSKYLFSHNIIHIYFLK